MASGFTIKIARSIDHPCKGFAELLDTSVTIAPGVVAKEARYTILADSLAVAPVIGMTIVADGTQRTIKNVALDPAKAAWEVLCSG